MPARFPTFNPDALGGEARTVHDRIMRDRGYLPGPYKFWLASPGFTDRIEPVEEFLRYGVALEERQVEIVVLVVARHCTSQYVWSSHAPAALKAGVEEHVVEAIRTRANVTFERDQDTVLFAFCKALLEEHAVNDSLWAQTESALGDRCLNEVLGLLGLYTSVCLTMVAYRMPPKDGETNPLP